MWRAQPLSDFGCGKIWFVPADIPPHKQKIAGHIVTFTATRWWRWRWRMQPDFLPSLLEAPEPEAHMERHPSYSIDTVRKVKAGLRRGDRLYFLIGIDAFRDIATWHEAEALLQGV